MPVATATTHFESNPSWLRVIIVKKDRFAAEYIRHAVTTCDGVAEVQCAQTAEAGLCAMRARAVHLGIFGLTFSDTDGIDLISSVKAERLAFRILVVSSRDDETARWYLRPGFVDGYVNPERDDLGTLRNIIATVANGGIYFSSKATKPHLKPATPPFTQLLSAHERKIFALLGDGCDDKQAGTLLELSQHTIHAHRRRIMSKLGIQSRTELMRAAIQRGVIRITSQRTLRPGLQAEFRLTPPSQAEHG